MAEEKSTPLKRLSTLFKLKTNCVAMKRATRRAAANELAYKSIPLGGGATKNCILHKHMGGYLLIELNRHNLPVRAFRDSIGILPISNTRVSTKKLAHLVSKIKPKILFMNDGEPLKSLFRTTGSNKLVSQHIKRYRGTLIDLLTGIHEDVCSSDKVSCLDKLLEITKNRRPTTTRKSRANNIAHNAIQLGEGPTKNCLLHKHMSGYLLIELNKHNVPVRAFRDSKGIFPVTSSRIDTAYLVQRVNQIKPTVLFLNDGEPLQTLFCTNERAPKITSLVKPYCGSLLDVLSEIREDDSCSSVSSSRTNFHNVHLLDPTISYPEYCSIYNEHQEK